MIPAFYARYCGPQALAVAIGGGPLRAARSLLAVQRVRGRPTAPGSVPEDMVLLAMRAGLAVERWSVERPSPAVAETCHELSLRVLAELAQDRAAPPGPSVDPFAAAWTDLAPTLPKRRRWQMVEQWRARGAAERFTLQEWLGQPGQWWLVADRTFINGELNPHLVAVSDGRIVAGDSADVSAYGPVPLVQAYRFYPTHEETTS